MYINDLIPYEFNNRNHSEQQIERIAKSISEFGFNQPIVIDEANVILVGHGRLAAAKYLGLEDVPVHVVKGLTDEQKRAYRILDNKLQNDSTWSFNNLELELGYLEDEGFDLPTWGLDELKGLFPDEEPEVEQDEIPEVHEKSYYIQPGDEIHLGHHRLRCADATKDHLFQVDFMFYSPPYNAGKSEQLSGNTHTTETKYVGASNDDLADEEYFLLINESLKQSLKSAKCVAVNIQQLAGNKKMLWDWLHLNVDHLVDVAIWEKTQAAPAMAKNVFTSAFEFVFWFSPKLNPSRAIPTANFRGNRKNIYKTESNSRNEFANCHAAGFPISFATEIIKTGSKKGDKVGDCFLGTGTTLIACEQLGRICYGIEIEPKYCQVIIERYVNQRKKDGKEIDIKINGEKYEPAEGW